MIYAFIDSQNLNLAIKSCGWDLDFRRFYVYLRDKYKVDKVFLFIGYVAGNEALYTFLQRAGYILIFKPTLEYKKGKERFTKGNVDAELVLHSAAIEFPKFDKAIIVSGDGDFHCLIEYLEKEDKLFRILVPNEFSFSSLLRKFNTKIAFVSRLKSKLEYLKK